MNDKRGTVSPERVALNAACVAWLLFVLGCGGVLCGLSCSTRSARTAAVAPTGDVAPDIWATDGEQEGGPIARPMPAKPFEGQKKAPCTTRRQVAINGGCWVELAAKPLEDQCGDDGYEHSGRCYIPVKQAKRPPTSVMP